MADSERRPIIAEDGNPGGMRSTLWNKTLGPDYVAKGFKLVKKYDLRTCLKILYQTR
jgi:hypothetical protein